MKVRSEKPQPGILAQWSSECPRCGEFITRNVDRIVFVRGNAIHLGCASGQDDQ